MKNDIKKITLSSIISALIVVLIAIGSLIDLLDITVAAVCTLAVFVIQFEIGTKYSFLVYLTSSVLSLILLPLTTSSLYYICFFGYYPLLKRYTRRFGKRLSKVSCALLFNIVMIILMLIFKAVFALQNEPWPIYAALLVTINVFFFCFDRLMDVFPILYLRKIRNKINFFK